MGAAKLFDFPPTDSTQDGSAPESTLQVARALVFISRTTVRSVILRELKAYGIEEVKVADSPKECIDDLQMFPESLLVLDWEFGEQKVVSILRAAQGKYRIDTRPIYFLALDVSERVIAVASEYNVTQIHSGEVSQAQIVKNLDELLHFALVSPACHQVFREVTELRKGGEKQAIVRTLKAFCAAEPQNLRAAIEYGYSLCDAGDIEAAKDCLEKLATEHPQELRVKHLLARCAMKQGRFDEAQALLEEASLISPHNIERLVDLGQVMLGLDRIDEALGTFQDVLKLDQDFVEAKIGKVQCDLLKGHVNDAIKMLAQMENPEEIASIFNGAAILAIRRQHFKQGLSLYKSAITYLGSNQKILARVFFNMGIGLLKWGKGEAALAAFGKAAALDPMLRKAGHNKKVLFAIISKGGTLNLARANLKMEIEDGSAQASPQDMVTDEPFGAPPDDNFFEGLAGDS